MTTSSLRNRLTLAALLLISAGLVFAHGDETHVMGTISKITASTITVKDIHGKSVDVAFTSATKFMKGDKLVSAKDIQAGERVVIHAKPAGGKLNATMVHVGAMKMMTTKAKHDDMKGMEMHPNPETSPK